jgi:hypothetical protein
MSNADEDIANAEPVVADHLGNYRARDRRADARAINDDASAWPLATAG